MDVSYMLYIYYLLQRESYLLSALITVGIYVLCTLITFFGVKERDGKCY